MPLFSEVLVSCGRLAGTVIAFFSPKAKQLAAERRAGLGEYPKAASPHHTEQVLAGGLTRLGAGNEADPCWKQAATYVQAAIVRPAAFKKPYVVEWLAQARTQELLRQHALDAHFGRKASVEGHAELTTTLMTFGGENNQIASSLVDVAIAFLRATLEGGAKDPLTFELIQEGQRHLSGKFEDLSEKLLRPAVPQITDAATSELQLILQRRACPGQSPTQELLELWSALGRGGRYELAAESVRRDVLLWMARVEASLGKGPIARKWASDLEARGGRTDSIVDALLKYAEGGGDAALQAVRQIDSSDGHSNQLFLLAKVQGEEAALSHFRELEPLPEVFFTPHGWRTYMALMVGASLYEEAEATFQKLSAPALEECPMLLFIGGHVSAIRLLPPERRQAAIDRGLLLLTEQLLDGPSAKDVRRTGIKRFDSCAEIATRIGAHKLSQECSPWASALRLVDDELRGAEVLEVQRRMSEVKQGVLLVQLASLFNVPFDPGPLEAHLAKQSMIGGLTDEETLARFEILKTKDSPSERLRFLEAEIEQLSRISSKAHVAMEMIKALCELKQTGRARELLVQHSADLGDDAQRAELMISQASGEDASSRAIGIYRSTGAFGDLANAIRVLERAERWSELVPLAQEFYRRGPNASSALACGNAMQRAAIKPRDVVGFLAGALDVVAATSELRSLYAWALFFSGDLQAAKAVNDGLRGDVFDPNQFGLDINIAVQTGDWDQFSQLLGRAKHNVEALPAKTLLTLSHVASFENPAQAFDLASQAAGRASGNPNLLLAAYQVALSVGREGEAGEWMQGAAQASDAQGPLKSFSFREVVELMKAQAEAWTEKNEKLRRGEVPLHLAVMMFNVPLLRLLVGIPRQNAEQAHSRLKQPLPVWAVGRPLESRKPFQTIALDATSIYLLYELQLLDAVLEAFSAVYISPNLFGFLLRERQRIVFHQPSRVKAAKPWLGLVDRRLLRSFVGDGPRVLIQMIGGTTAGLLAAARAQQGLFVHAGPIYDIASNRESVADVAEYSAYVTAPTWLADWLLQEGRITAQRHEQAVARLAALGRGNFPDPPSGTPENGIFLDPPMVEYLSSAELLVPLVNTGVPVFVDQDTIQEWKALIATEATEADMVQVISEIRGLLRTGLASGKLRFLARNRPSSEEAPEIIESGLADIVGAPGQVDAVCVDDRMLTGTAAVSDRGVSVPMLSTADLLEELKARDKISVDIQRQALHQMRERCLYFVPLQSDDLQHMLLSSRVGPDGELRESAQMRVLRQYLAKLDLNRKEHTEADLNHLDALWRTGTSAIQALWAEDGDALEAAAKSTWILDNVIGRLPVRRVVIEAQDEKASLALLTPSEEKVVEVEATRMLYMAMSGINGTRRAGYADWLNERMRTHLPGSIAILDRVVERVANVVTERENAEVDEATIARYMLGGLPDLLRSRLVDTPAVFEVARLGKGRTQTGIDLNYHAIHSHLGQAALDIVVHVPGEGAAAPLTMRRTRSGVFIGLPGADEPTSHFPALGLMDPDLDVRVKAFDLLTKKALPMFPRGDYWRKLILEERLSVFHFVHLNDDLQGTASSTLRRIEGMDQFGLPDLVPTSRRHYESLIGVAAPTLSADEYRQQILVPHLRSALRKNVAWGWRCVAASFTGLKVFSPAQVCEEVSADELLAAVAPRARSTAQALLATAELCLTRGASDPRFLAVASETLDRIALSVTEESDGVSEPIAAALAEHTLGILGTDPNLQGAPVYWRRQAAMAHADVVAEALSLQPEDLAGLVKECRRNRTPEQVAANLFDLHLDPHWQPDHELLMLPWRRAAGCAKVLVDAARSMGQEIQAAQFDAYFEGERGRIRHAVGMLLANSPEPIGQSGRPFQQDAAETLSVSVLEGLERPWEDGAWRILLAHSSHAVFATDVFEALESELEALPRPVDLGVLKIAARIAAYQGSTRLANSVVKLAEEATPSIASVQDVWKLFEIVAIAASAVKQSEDWVPMLRDIFSELAVKITPGICASQLERCIECLDQFVALHDREWRDAMAICRSAA